MPDMTLKQLKEEYYNKKMLLRPVDETIVDQYAMAMRDGAKFPALVIGHWPEAKDFGTKGIVDGVQRLFAALEANRLYNANIKTLPVEVKQYKNSVDVLVDQPHYNAQHGHRTAPKFRNKRILDLETRGVPRVEIAKSFGLSEMSISRILRGLQGEPESANEKRSASQKGKSKGSFSAFSPKPFVSTMEKLQYTMVSKKAKKELADFLDPDTEDKKILKQKEEDVQLIVDVASLLQKFVKESLS